jgi:selenocysteine lyase/cysteine desulfurase
MSSEVYAWQECCWNHLSVEIIVVPHPTSQKGWTPLILEYLEKGNVDVCCLPQVHWSDGSFVDLKIIGRYCSEQGIKFVVDGTQSIGVMEFHVEEIMCDAVACSVHKWLLSPHGMSLVYIHPKYHNSWLPLDQHERSRVVFQDEIYDAVENKIGQRGYPEEFLSGAKRCDSGGKKNPILEPMICQGLKIVNSIDLEKAQAYLKRLTDEILEGGRRLGFDVQPGPRCGHIIGLRPRSEEMVQLLTPERMVRVAKQLQKRGVFLAVRSGAFRISPYLYTNSKDVKRLIAILEEECEKVKVF